MQKYLITSPELYTQDPALFVPILREKIKKHAPHYVLYRDKTNEDYGAMAKEFIKVCREFGSLKCFLHQDADLAKELGADGVHLSSLQFDAVERSKNMGLEVIISTHTHQEVLKAENLGADAATYSPIFVSPGKGEPKGVGDLREIVAKSYINIFALGGIVTEEQVADIMGTGAFGFASIRYFA